MKDLNHPNIKLFKVIVTEETLFLIMEPEWKGHV